MQTPSKSFSPTFDQRSVADLIATLGDGDLRDHSECSLQFRGILAQSSIDCVGRYIQEVLAQRISNGGLILQDLVNEIGSRLGFNVESGLYRGRQGKIGYDGLWMSEEANFLVEVKTSDAYRINLDTVANYANQIRESRKEFSKELSMLLIVGRQDTGDLEAQVRGSKHAWETRIIGVEALLEAAEACEEYASQQTKKSVRELLLPEDYTRLDSILRKIVTAINETETLVEQSVEHQKSDTEYEIGADRVVESTRDCVIESLSEELGPIERASSATFYFGNHRPLYVLVSKRYNRSQHQYWYAFSSEKAQDLKNCWGLMALGMKDRPYFFLLTHDVFMEALEGMNKVTKSAQDYWQVAVSEANDGFFIELPMTGGKISLAPFKRMLDWVN